MTDICICCSFPEQQNSNDQIISNIADGFVELLSEHSVKRLNFQTAEKSILRYRPSVLLMIGTPLLSISDYSGIAQACKKTNTKFVFWTFEDPYDFDANVKFASYADYVITNDLNCLDFYERENVYHLPLGANAKHLRPLQNYGKRALDVFFCGVGFKNRQRIINDAHPILSKYKSRIYGDNWKEKPGNVIQNKRIPTSQIFDFYEASKIVLNMGRDHSFANNSRALTSVTPGPRTFEAAMVGCVQFYYQPSSALSEYFQPDEEIVVFNDIDDLKSKLQYYIAEPETMKSIADKAQQRCLKDHSYKRRAEQIWDICMS